MSLDVQDTAFSTIERLKSRATLAVIGLSLLLAAVVGLGAAAAFAVGGAAGSVIGLLTAVAYVAGIAMIGVGAFRSYDEMNYSKSQYTENIVKPFLRLSVSGMLLYLLAILAAYVPLVIGAIVASPLALMNPEGALTGLSGPLASILGLAAASIGMYVATSMILSLPGIAVSDQRLFESLDKAVQRSKGNRLRMIASLLPAVVAGAVGFGAATYLGDIVGGLIYLVALAFAQYYNLALLTELNDRL